MKKVKYIGCSQSQIRWGGNNDPKDVLKVGEIYDVAKKEVHSWHTKIFLVGIEGKFNSVCFESAKAVKNSQGLCMWQCPNCKIISAIFTKDGKCKDCGEVVNFKTWKSYFLYEAKSNKTNSADPINRAADLQR